MLGVAEAIEAGRTLRQEGHAFDVAFTISDEDIMERNNPTGTALLYELDDDLAPVRHRYLGEQEAIRKATQAVAAYHQLSI